MSISYQREPIADLWEELMPLLERHYREIAHWQDIALDPDRVLYEAIERAGQLRLYTARRDGALIGYVIFFVRFNLHYRHSLQAVQDVVFVAPEHRTTGVGRGLLRFAGDALGAERVQVVIHHAKHAHPELGQLLEAEGYEPIETLYAKRLDQEDD